MNKMQMYGGSVTSSAKNAVLYTELNLTEEQKSQARSNIGDDLVWEKE